jgi:uncharacterized protein YjcR
MLIMNKNQYAYDQIVQVRNMKSAIDRLRSKIRQLENVKCMATKKGHVDKEHNLREYVLSQYREQLTECERRKMRSDHKLKFLENRITPPKIGDNPKKRISLGMSANTGLLRTPTKKK